jgi:phospho-N-acetylmuramoyl-pentapeptide-transferase
MRGDGFAYLLMPPAWAWFQVPADRPNVNMAYSLGLACLSFVLAAVLGRYVVAFLRARKIGKQVRPEEPEQNQVKTGTPTMGGLIFIVPAISVTIAFNLYARLSMLLPIGVLVACGILGALDDRLSLVGGARSGGMSVRMKALWLLLCSAIIAVILYWPLGLHHFTFPGLGRHDIGLLYLPLAALGIFAMANAVNFTDGLDALAGGTGMIAFVAYGIIAYIQGQVGVVTFCFIMVGALLGYLWHNAHPAQVIMGDTGALALGAGLATAALMTGQWVLLPIVGLVFVAEALSVVIQVAYFKRTGGRRFFKKSPVHYHFLLLGWSESQVMMRFLLVGIMAGLFGVALALL